MANVIPIYKKGSKLQASNYRPISLLSNINKIFENIIFSSVYSFLDKYECLYSLQCGVFVDFQKAFDTVNHKILLDKLDHYGIRGSINKWFKSYLTDRKQYVSIIGLNSNISTIKHGVPQGSGL